MLGVISELTLSTKVAKFFRKKIKIIINYFVNMHIVWTILITNLLFVLHARAFKATIVISIKHQSPPVLYKTCRVGLSTTGTDYNGKLIDKPCEYRMDSIEPLSALCVP